MPEQLTPLSDEELAEIEARANAATTGPWYPRATDDESFMNALYVGLDEGPGWRHDNVRGMSAGDDEQEPPDRVVAITLLQMPALALCDDDWDANTEFIAHSRVDIDRLLATVRAREARIQELEGRRCGNCKHSIALASAYVMCRGRGRKGKGDLCEIWEASNNE